MARGGRRVGGVEAICAALLVLRPAVSDLVIITPLGIAREHMTGMRKQPDHLNQIRRRLSRLKRGLDYSEDISEWHAIQAEIATLTRQLQQFSAR